jgi:hypothetical protein
MPDIASPRAPLNAGEVLDSAKDRLICVIYVCEIKHKLQ